MVVEGARLETGAGWRAAGALVCWRGRGQGVGGVACGELLLGLSCGDVRLRVGELVGGLDGGAVGADDLHAEEVAGGVFLEAHHHGFEHLEGLFFVGDEGILLRVAAEADAFLEVVHGEEMILPKAVEDGEHDDALVVAHGGGAEDLLLDVVAGAELVEDGLAEFVAIELGGVDLVFEVRAEDVVELGEERLELPLVGVDLLGCVLIEDVGEDGGEVVVGDELLLIDSLHELAAETVDGFALLVHDVVVFEDVFAGFEVLSFDCLLRGFDAAGDHAGFDGDALFHAEALEERGDPLAGEDAHEIVFEGEEEARRAGVALTAGAATKLVVDAAGFVALGAEDVEAAGGDDGFVLFAGGALVGGDGCVPCGLRGFELLAGVVEAEHAGAGDWVDGTLRHAERHGLAACERGPGGP